jgi:hypothetical protein
MPPLPAITGPIIDWGTLAVLCFPTDFLIWVAPISLNTEPTTKEASVGMTHRHRPDGDQEHRHCPRSHSWRVVPALSLCYLAETASCNCGQRWCSQLALLRFLAEIYSTSAATWPSVSMTVSQALLII